MLYCDKWNIVSIHVKKSPLLDFVLINYYCYKNKCLVCIWICIVKYLRSQFNRPLVSQYYCKENLAGDGIWELFPPIFQTKILRKGKNKILLY